VIVGTYGAGKSTLAARLAALLNYPVHHLDASRWEPGWKLRPRADWLRELDAHLAAPAWIVDGNFEATLDRRLVACDTVIFLDFPLLGSAYRVLRRRLSREARRDLPT
jgi:adenylate kinase family enzyme